VVLSAVFVYVSVVARARAARPSLNESSVNRVITCHTVSQFIIANTI
jgi:hypothetical protein